MPAPATCPESSEGWGLAPAQVQRQSALSARGGGVWGARRMAGWQVWLRGSGSQRGLCPEGRGARSATQWEGR